MIAPARRHVPRELAGIFAALAADLKELRWWGSPAGPLHVAGYAPGQIGADRAAGVAATLGWRLVVPPECEGRKGEELAGLFLRCRFCGGLGWVGGHNEPAERGECPPPEPPPAWEHKVWKNPAVAAALSCRYCLDAKVVSRIDGVARTLVTAPCLACAQPLRE